MLAAVSLSQRAFGQGSPEHWVHLASFSRAIDNPYFFDPPNGTPAGAPPIIGFLAGDSNSIYRTSDGGLTWKLVLVPNKPQMMRDFVFKDALTGWAAATSTVYKTIDGGLTWFALPVAVQGIHFNSIAYDKTTKRLLVTGWGIPTTSLYSIDDGAHWTPMLVGSSASGFAFIDDQVAFVANDWPQPGPPPPGKPTWHRTNDGALSWTSLTQPSHTWQPAAIPDQKRFVASITGSDTIISSIDAGLTWQITYRLPGYFGTGCLRLGDCDQLYRQATGISRPLGIEVSADAGLSWKSLGGPGGDAQSRFCVARNCIYSVGPPINGPGDRHDLWMLQRSTEPFFEGTLLTLPTICTILDTSLVIYAPECDSIVLVSVASDNVAKMQPGSGISNKPIPQGQFVQAPFQIASHHSGDDTCHLTYRIKRAGRTFDTTVTYVLRVTNTSGLTAELSASRLRFDSTPTCSTDIRYLTLRHSSCTSLTIDSVWLVAANRTLALLHGLNRHTTTASEIDSVAVAFSPIDTLLSATAALHLLLTTDGFTRDTIIPIAAIGRVSQPTFSGRNVLDFGKRTVCVPATDTLWLKNDWCDSILATSVVQPGDKRLTASPRKLPAWIHTGDSLPIVVSYMSSVTGAASDSLVLTFFGAGQTINGSDTGRLLVRILAQTTPKMHVLAEDLLAINNVEPCGEFDTTLVIYNPSLCDTLIVSAITLEDSSVLASGHAGPPWSTFIADTGSTGISVVQLPRTLLPSGSLPLHVTLRPSSTDTIVALLHVHGAAPNGSGGTYDSTFSIRARTKPTSARLSMTDTAGVALDHFDFPIAAIDCEPDTTRFLFANSSCRAILIDSITWVPSNPRGDGALGNGTFRFTDSLPGFTLAPGVAHAVVTEFSPNSLDTVNGSLEGFRFAKATISYHGEDGLTHDTTLVLTGRAIQRPKITTYLNASTVSAPSGGSVSIPIYATNRDLLTGASASSLEAVRAAAIRTVECSLSLNCDLLAPIRAVSSITGANVQAFSHSDTDITFAVTMPQGFAPQGNVQIATLECQAFLTDTLETQIAIRGVTAESDPRACLELASAPTPIHFRLDAQCGDSLISHAMRKGVIVDRITPNPATNTLSIEFHDARALLDGGAAIGGSGTSQVKLQLYDLLGRNAQLYVRSDVTGSDGHRKVQLDLERLKPGGYILRISGSGILRSFKIEIDR